MAPFLLLNVVTGSLDLLVNFHPFAATNFLGAALSVSLFSFFSLRAVVVVFNCHISNEGANGMRERKKKKKGGRERKRKRLFAFHF